MGWRVWEDRDAYVGAGGDARRPSTAVRHFAISRKRDAVALLPREI